MPRGRKKKEEVAEVKEDGMKTVDQMMIARIISAEMPDIQLGQIQAIIQREQELTIQAVKEGRKVVKKNYLTIYPSIAQGKSWKSPLNGETYTIPPHSRVCVRVGEGFKSAVGGKDMPRKLCRSVQQMAQSA